MSDAQIEQEIQAKGLTAPRITPAGIAALMARVEFVTHTPGGTTSTFVHAYLDGKFYLASGHSACVSVANFNAEIGYRIAHGKVLVAAQDKLWELEGYYLYAALKEQS